MPVMNSPQQNYNPQMQQRQQTPMAHTDSTKDHFCDLLNQIIAYLDEGHVWHMNAGSTARLNGIRGWGQWHTAEAKCDAGKRLELTKLIGDIPSLRHVPATNVQKITDAHTYAFPTINSPEDLKSALKAHHDTWIEREKRFCDIIKQAMKMAATFDGNLYSVLLCLQKEVENEIFRVGIVAYNLWIAGYEGHHIIVVSKWLHEYFEKEYSEGPIDFNIG